MMFEFRFEQCTSERDETTDHLHHRPHSTLQERPRDCHSRPTNTSEPDRTLGRRHSDKSHSCRAARQCRSAVGHPSQTRTLLNDSTTNRTRDTSNWLLRLNHGSYFVRSLLTTRRFSALEAMSL